MVKGEKGCKMVHSARPPPPAPCFPRHTLVATHQLRFGKVIKSGAANNFTVKAKLIALPHTDADLSR